MELLFVSFFAGALTVAAPCILPLLPVIVGGSVAASSDDKRWWRPLVITGSLVVSVVAFTLLLRATTALLGIPQTTWNIIAGLIVIVLGISFVYPKLWDLFALKSGLYKQSTKLNVTAGNAKPGLIKDILTGVSLGPVFSSCSPTYAFIIAAVLPVSFAQGFSYLLAYALGLAMALLLLAIAGQSLVSKLGWLRNPNGAFRKVIGVLFIIVGLAVSTGLDRDFQAYVLEQGWYEPIERIEKGFGLD